MSKHFNKISNLSYQIENNLVRLPFVHEVVGKLLVPLIVLKQAKRLENIQLDHHGHLTLIL